MDSTVRRAWWLVSGPLLAVAVSVSSLWLLFDDYRTGPPDLLDVELALLVGLPLAWRRRFPLAVLAVVAVAVAALAATRREVGPDQLAVLVALAAAVRRNRRWRVVASVAVAGAALVVASVKDELYNGEAGELLWIPIAVGVTALAGAVLRQWDARHPPGPTRRARPARPSPRVLGALVAAAAVIAAIHVPVERAVFGPARFAGQQWQVDGNGSVEAITTTSDGDVLVLFRQDKKATLARYSDGGRRRWQRQVAEVIPDADGGDLAAMAGGGAVLAVTRTDPIATGLDSDITTGLVLRVDGDGEVVWETLLAGPVTGVFDIAAAADGTVAVVGQRPSPDEASPRPAFVEAFTPDGGAAWDDVITATGAAGAFATVFDGEGRLVVAGSRGTGEEADAFVRTYRPGGELVRDNAIDVDDADIVSDLAINGDGDLVTVLQSAGSFTSSGRITSTVRVTGPDGSRRWEARVRGEGTTAEAVAIAGNGDVIVVGNRPRRLWGLDLNLDLAVYRWDAGGRRRSVSRVGTKADDLLRPGGLALTADGDLLLAHDRNPSGIFAEGAVARVRAPWK